MDNTQKFIDLRNRIIKKQTVLNNLKLPKTHFSKRELRTGLMGRAQRREQVRFYKKVKMEKEDLARKRSKIERYLERVESIQAPKITFIKDIPKLKQVRGRLRKQKLRRKKR